MMSEKDITMTSRQVFVPYINGHVYDLWGGEPNSIRVFASVDDAKVFGFLDIRRVELWEIRTADVTPAELPSR